MSTGKEIKVACSDVAVFVVVLFCFFQARPPYHVEKKRVCQRLVCQKREFAARSSSCEVSRCEV